MTAGFDTYMNIIKIDYKVSVHFSKMNIISKLNLNDQVTFDLLSSGETMGIFQLEIGHQYTNHYLGICMAFQYQATYCA